MRRAILVVALVACHHKAEWKTDRKLAIDSSSAHAPFQQVEDLDRVQPKLIVEGQGALRAAVEAELARAGIGKTGNASVTIKMPGTIEGSGSVPVDVQVAGGWAASGLLYEVNGTIGGTIEYESSGDVATELTADVAKGLAGEIVKMFEKAAPAHPAVPRSPASATAIGSGLHMNCSLHQDGTVRCWSAGRSATLGVVPAELEDVHGAVELAIGDDVGCARLGDGTVRCWDVSAWQDDARASHPVCGLDHVVGLGRGAPACARKADGSVVCWTEAGFAADCNAAAVATVPKLVAQQLATSFFAACAIDGKHQVACWEPCHKQCEKLAAKPIAALAGSTALAAGGYVCGIVKSDTVRCIDVASGKAEDVAVPGAVAITNGFGYGIAVTGDKKAVRWDSKAGTVAELPVVGVVDASAAPQTGCVIADGGGSVSCWDQNGTLARVVYAP